MQAVKKTPLATFPTARAQQSQAGLHVEWTIKSNYEWNGDVSSTLCGDSGV